MYHFQILYNTPLGVCLCDTPTPCGAWVFTSTEEQAQSRANELKAIGIDVWYESIDKCWANDNQWIG